MRYLIANGLDVNAKDDHGETALMWASSVGKTDSIRLFLSKGADIYARDNDGKTALAWANGHPATVTILKAAGAK